MGTPSIARALEIAAAVAIAIGTIAIGTVAAPASAQRLGRASDAVRGGGGSRSGGSLGGASSTVRGASGGAASSGSRGGGSSTARGSGGSGGRGGSLGGSSGGSSSWSAGPRTPDRPAGPPARIGRARLVARTFVVVPPAATVVVAEGEQPPPERIEASPRDHWYGGSLGVRLVAPIGPPPRAAGEGYVPGGGTPVGAMHDEPRDLRVAPRDERVLGVVSADAGYVLDAIARGTVSARVELPASIDVFATYTAYIEPTPTGFDALLLGRAGIGLRAIDEAEAQLRIGVALRHFHDWLGSVFGIDGVLGLDVAIEEPVVLSTEASIGTAGSAFVAQLRGTLGLRFDRVQIYAGYEHVTLQPLDGESAGVDLTGPVAGIAVVVD